MELLKKGWRNLSVRRFFMFSVLLTVGIVVFFSFLIIWGCRSFRYWLLPDENAAYLVVEETLSDGSVVTSENLLSFGEDLSSIPELMIEKGGKLDYEDVSTRKYSLKKIEKSFDSLSPKRKLAYQVSGAAMVAAPAALAFIGIIWCSLYFYRKKLKQPLELLAGATDKIMEQNLDFELAYDCADEMGALCQSFEKMRQALYENNRKMWEMLEERRLLQASVAHDLRNPIAITKGYAEYLYTGMQRGGLDREKTCRILENIMSNALRFAKTQIILTFSMSGHILSITVEDDGEGFGPWIKEKKKKAFLAHGTDGHLGIGLAVSRILCQKHGGGLELANTQNGACAKFFLEV